MQNPPNDEVISNTPAVGLPFGGRCITEIKLKKIKARVRVVLHRIPQGKLPGCSREGCPPMLDNRSP